MDENEGKKYQQEDCPGYMDHAVHTCPGYAANLDEIPKQRDNRRFLLVVFSWGGRAGGRAGGE
jgi:hypothetical protein